MEESVKPIYKYSPNCCGTCRTMGTDIDQYDQYGVLLSFDNEFSSLIR